LTPNNILQQKTIHAVRSGISWLFGVTTKDSELSFCDSPGDSAVAMGSPTLPVTLEEHRQNRHFNHGNDTAHSGYASATGSVSGTAAQINADFARTGRVLIK
jgi:hypothetical protein